MNYTALLPRRMWASVVVISILFIGKYAVLMKGSVVFGRLAMPPQYDDVSYFVDALERVRIFESDGLRAVLKNAIDAPPHAPYSTIAAGLAFLLIGPYPAAAYFMNVVSLLLITSFWIWLFEVPFTVAALFGVAIICTGWFDSAVTIFHPDLIMGYGAAVIAAALVFQEEVLFSIRRVAAVGAAAGLVLLAKPSALAALLAFLLVAFVAGAFASRAAGDTFWALGRRTAIGVGAMVLVAGSYYAVNLATVIQYIYAVLVSDQEVWDAHLTGMDDFFYYVYQFRELFGVWGYLGLGIVLMGVAWSALRGNTPTALRFSGLMLCTLAAYLIPTVTSVKAMRFGMLLYGMIAVNLGIGLLHLHHQIEMGRWRSLVLAGAAGVFVLAIMTFADNQPRFPSDMLIDSTREYEGVSALIQQQHELHRRNLLASGRSLSLLQPLLIKVPSEAYRFRLLRDGLKLDVGHYELENDLQIILAAAQDADIVVVPDAPLRATLYHYRVNSVIDAFRDKLPASGFVQIGSVAMTVGNVLIFARPEDPG